MFQRITTLILVGLLAAPLQGENLYVPDDHDTIQAAIDAASHGDEILVAPGTYFETIDFLGKKITVVSASGPDDTIIDGDGNAPVVRFEYNETAASVLEGFTITGGTDGSDLGGGVVIDRCSPTVRGNIITGNRAGSLVGGGGGGIYIIESQALIEDNIIEDNESYGWIAVGGGILIEAAVCIDYVCTSTPTIRRNLIIGNQSVLYGGGIAVGRDAVPIIEYNVISGNDALAGAGVSLGTTPAVLRNNTIIENSADSRAAGVAGGSDSTIINCILWGNDAPESPQLDPELIVHYSCIEGGSDTGDGIVDLDPLLVDPAARDYRLQSASWCIDGGDPASPLDPDGSVADIGAGLSFLEGDKFLRGDVNGNGDVDPLTDAMALLRWAFTDGAELPCMDAADVNDSGVVSPIADSMALLTWAFSGGAAPPAPGPRDCGTDPTEDPLDCRAPLEKCD